MGSGRVKDRFPKDDGGEQSPPLCYHEMLENLCPDYMAMGMTWDEYWYGDPLMTIAYRKAFHLKQESRNKEMWMQGMYIYEALLDVSPMYHDFAKNPKPLPYPDRPYPLTKEEQEKREADKEAENDKKTQEAFKAWAKRANRMITEREAKKGVQADG